MIKQLMFLEPLRRGGSASLSKPGKRVSSILVKAWEMTGRRVLESHQRKQKGQRRGVWLMAFWAAVWSVGNCAAQDKVTGAPSQNQGAEAKAAGLGEKTYADRTDSVAQKGRHLERAYAQKNFRLAQSILASMKQTLQFEEQQGASIGEPLLPASASVPVTTLPAVWREWAAGWSYVTPLTLEETAGEDRLQEPVEFVAAFQAEHTVDLGRELRVARIENGSLREVRSQVSEEILRGGERLCRITLLADQKKQQKTHWLVFHGNPEAERPEYSTDLKVQGEGLGLEIENEFFRASLSKSIGQLTRLGYKREHGLELFAGGVGHGEAPGIDWAYDYVTAGGFQKMRINNWPETPSYEVIRGPLSLKIRRWGFPSSPLHPVFTPSRIHVSTEYTFYSGTPWFLKTGTMDVLQDLEISYLRDDEWVFSGMSFTDTMWIPNDGRLRTGPVEAALNEELQAVGFFHKSTRDAFLGLFLEHTATNAPPLKNPGSPSLFYKGHGQLWSRALYRNTTLKAGASLHQKNAYLTLPFPEKEGGREFEAIRRKLLSPLKVSCTPLPETALQGFTERRGRLARAGEAGDSQVAKALLWKALEECRDEQLYTARPSVVELGLIYDIRIRADVVHVLMAMPHHGRPRLDYLSDGGGGNKAPVREVLLRVPGVRDVVVEQVWDPVWTTNRITEEGRRKLGY